MGRTIAIIVVVFLVIGGGVIWYMNNKNAYGPQASPSPTVSASVSASPTTSPNVQTTDKVTIADMAFSPASITVKKGTTVTWTNNDSMAHTVTETDGKSGPDSGNLTNGKSYNFTFNTVGTFKYDCSIHPSMTGTVTVTE